MGAPGKRLTRRRGAARRREGVGSAGGALPAPSELLKQLKRHGPLTIRELAAALDITYEAIRQQMGQLLRAGWIAATGAPGPGRRPGPASQRYTLSAAAEHLFPKHYDELSAELVQQVMEHFGGRGVTEILKSMTDARVRRWAPRLASMTLKEKLATLCSLYEDKDAYMQLEWKEGGPALIERNCPFLNVAQAHPAICSVSVNTLERLLGYKVVREQRFQAGHGRCVFRVRVDEPSGQDEGFTLEP
jgi:predicted ArsR family transcriptional regulator